MAVCHYVGENFAVGRARHIAVFVVFELMLAKTQDFGHFGAGQPVMFADAGDFVGVRDVVLAAVLIVNLLESKVFKFGRGEVFLGFYALIANCNVLEFLFAKLHFAFSDNKRGCAAGKGTFHNLVCFVVKK